MRDSVKIKFVEIGNFRKLKSVRIDLADKTTLFVGANNSGKTSAMAAFGRFLIDRNDFTLNDFTLSNIDTLNQIGRTWLAEDVTPEVLETLNDQFITLLPSMDVWLQVEETEIHYVSHLLPTLDWIGGQIGVRYRLEPKKILELRTEFIVAYKNAKEITAAAKADLNDFAIWPENLTDFINRKMKSLFCIRSYTLNPSDIKPPINGTAAIQSLMPNSEPFESNPLNGLIRIDVIDAQRGFSDSKTTANYNDGDESRSEAQNSTSRKLSEQLRTYFRKHLDPSDMPTPEDLGALKAIKDAQIEFDGKLKASFKEAIEEVENLGYPGISDPSIHIKTKIRPVDGLNHSSAVQYSVVRHSEGDGIKPLMLPEDSNGLGYQNLISIIFRLMSFRDAWMRVGKANKPATEINSDEVVFEPIHLVLVEEPEAHLHIQVQQVFINKAYEVLRKHSDLGENVNLTTQLIVSTHSSHVAHELEFSCMRYFRRKPATEGAVDVPTSLVVNLTEVFDGETTTKRFVKRYLKITHCDLFFADAAIFVEGPAERILLPHFIKNEFEGLSKCYLTILEIGGSHAHRFRKLIEHLGINTLIVTDLDAAKLSDSKLTSENPVRNQSMVSQNSTLRTWIPNIKEVDTLIDLPEANKVMEIDEFSSIRVSYQIPIMISHNDEVAQEAIPNTFEDALIYQNFDIFKSLSGKGLVSKVKKTINESANIAELSKNLHEAISKGDKAAFALDLLYLADLKTNILTPKYIADGLVWLSDQMTKKSCETMSPIDGEAA